MNYYNLKSLVAGRKRHFTMRAASDSFCFAAERSEPFIPPTFTKIEFDAERPAVILISAVGASGKTTLAQVLSSEVGLPLLDLGKHKPVAEHSLTGLMTTSFPHQDISAIIESLVQGTYGLIIDGVDEARAKTTEKGFDAFLDNVANLCPSQPGTSFVLLGRTEVLEYCWYYLIEKGVQAALITIESFGLESARDYIDKYTAPVHAGHLDMYRQVRDKILGILAGAFEGGTRGSRDFLSFIGYPPVLDAIVTLLRQEQNYYKLLAGLEGNGSSDVEIGLLHRIASYILIREKEEKVKPSILSYLVDSLPETVRADTLERTYDAEEQCIRLVSWVVNRPVALKKIQHPVCDEDYEKALSSFLPEHPFLVERRFRNAVFESFALATLMVSQDPNCSDLLSEYVRSHKYNYHLIYLLDAIAAEKSLPLRYLGIILGSAMEFRSTNSTVELRVDGPAAGDSLPSASPQDVQIEISIVLGKDGTDTRSFVFGASSDNTASIELGPRLSTAYLTLPCEVTFNGGPELEFTAPVEVSAGRLNMAARELILRRSATADDQDSDSVILEAESITSNLVSIVANDVPLAFITSDRAGLTYPAINYVEERRLTETDPLLHKKYFRLRRILLMFRSHKRGTLARFREKIEDERVMGYGVGDDILRRLLKDGVIRLEGQHYFLEPENLDRYLGISWLHLRLGHTSEKLLQYLRSVE
jgi:hypothetical protein